MPGPDFTSAVAVAPFAMIPPRVSVPAAVVMVRLAPAAAPNVVAPMPKFRSRVPVKTKLPLIVSG